MSRRFRDEAPGYLPGWPAPVRVVCRCPVAQAGAVEGAHRRRSGPQAPQAGRRHAPEGDQPGFHEQRFHLRRRGKRPGRRRDVLSLRRHDLQSSRHRPGRRHGVSRAGGGQLRRAAQRVPVLGQHADHPERPRRVSRQERPRFDLRPRLSTPTATRIRMARSMDFPASTRPSPGLPARSRRAFLPCLSWIRPARLRLLRWGCATTRASAPTPGS